MLLPFLGTLPSSFLQLMSSNISWVPFSQPSLIGQGWTPEQSRPIMVSVLMPTILKSRNNYNQSTLLSFLTMGSETLQLSGAMFPVRKKSSARGESQAYMWLETVLYGKMERTPWWFPWLHLSRSTLHISSSCYYLFDPLSPSLA